MIPLRTKNYLFITHFIFIVPIAILHHEIKLPMVLHYKKEEWQTSDRELGSESEII